LIGKTWTLERGKTFGVGNETLKTSRKRKFQKECKKTIEKYIEGSAGG